MIQIVNIHDFRSAFIAHGRENQFSYEALELIFDYCEEWEDGKWELDVIELCCDISESKIDEIVNNYSIDISDCENEAEVAEVVTEYLIHNTIFIGYSTNSQLVYFQF